jgi:hypothetical protein
MADINEILRQLRGRPGDLNNFAERIEESKQRHNIEMKPTNNLNVTVSVAGNDYAISFGYNTKLLKALKDAIPESERTWHKGRKVWLISPEAIGRAIDVLKAHTGQPIPFPCEAPSAPEVMEKSFLLEYLGTTKDRGKRKSAYGSVNGEWAVEMPEDVLMSFFEKRELGQPLNDLQTLYQVLCVVESVEPEQIRKAYKRLALQWHPDTCKEPDAHERFIKINEAYKILIDPEQRRRYDAGLYFEREGQSQGYTTKIITRPHLYGYRSPLRCGQITARGTVRLMRFVVSEIIKWDDVIDSDGRVMVTSWPKDSDRFVIEWLNQSPF